ncbi:MAG TPA: hypothetical protein VF855_10880, partial [Acidimicrobiales bacterium]
MSSMRRDDEDTRVLAADAAQRLAAQQEAAKQAAAQQEGEPVLAQSVIDREATTVGASLGGDRAAELDENNTLGKLAGDDVDDALGDVPSIDAFDDLTGTGDVTVTKTSDQLTGDGGGEGQALLDSVMNTDFSSLMGGGRLGADSMSSGGGVFQGLADLGEFVSDVATGEYSTKTAQGGGVWMPDRDWKGWEGQQREGIDREGLKPGTAAWAEQRGDYGTMTTAKAEEVV